MSPSVAAQVSNWYRRAYYQPILFFASIRRGNEYKFATPILGVSLTLGFEMVAQLIGGLLLDGFGWLEVKRTPVDRLRIVGALVVLLGVILVTLSRL